MSVEMLLNAARKKQLGQYFTDQRVGRLLAVLSDAQSAKTIIDPMVGSADLLQACLSVGSRPERLVGIELDPIALERARSTLVGVKAAELTVGDAFTTPLPSIQFDLVITNPPYIRYQSRGEVDGISVPTSAGVRAGLIRAIKARSGLGGRDQELWLRAANGYPGTSDIAVPAWILSAALVREGGVLAVVAPHAWLSRNYAHSVRSLLDTAFDVELIVEDGDASWFHDAQVRTHLVVARRRPLTERVGQHQTVVARATGALVKDGDLRGALASEQSVAKALRQVSSLSPVTVTTGLTAHAERGMTMVKSSQVASVPSRVAAALGTDDLVTRTLETYGWRAGQGLRSGANDFFYVSAVGGLVRPAARWGLDPIAVPSECLLTVIRRQSELGDDFEVDESRLTSRVLSFEGWVTAADLKKMSPSDANVLPSAVGQWIGRVARTPLLLTGPTKLFPELTAVATNHRTDQSGRPTRFWYQLPALAPRHRPILFVGRVCGGRPKTFLNSGEVVVDANFSSLWPVEPDAMPSDALMALLNSSWVWASLESACTVLGGGALKVEATDLRRLALPDLLPETVERLAELGRALVREPTDTVIEAIDEVVVGSAVRGQGTAGRVVELRALAERALQQRSRD